MPSVDAIAWQIGANANIANPKPKPEELNFEVRKSKPQPKPIQMPKPTLRLEELNFEVRKAHPPPIREVQTKSGFEIELRKLIAQGIPPEKAAQIIAERYGVKAEVRKVQMPSLTHISQKFNEAIRKSRPEPDIIGKAELEIARRRVELEQRGDVERNPLVRLGIGAELVGLGLTQGAINVGKGFADLASLAVRNPIEAGKQFVTGSIEWVKSIPTRIQMGFTESPFFAGTVAGEIALAEAGGRAIGRFLPEKSISIRMPKKLTEFKPEFTVIEIGEQKTIMEGKPPTNVALAGIKDLGKVREIKPVSALTVEAGFKLKEGEGFGVGKIRQRFAWQMRTEKGEPIRITTFYKNPLGKRAMITSEFTEEGVKILAKRAKGEAKGLGIRIVETQPIRSQEMTEKPVIRLLGQPKEFIPTEEPAKAKPPKVIDVRGLIGELPKVEKKPKEVEVGKGIKQIVKAEEREGKAITVVDVSKEVKQLEKVITTPKTEYVSIGMPSIAIPLAVPPAFGPPSPRYAFPSISALSSPIAPMEIAPMEIVKPTQSFTVPTFKTPTFGALGSVSFGVSSMVKPLTQPIQMPSIGLKPLAIETPKLGLRTETKPLVDVDQIMRTGLKPTTGFKPAFTPTTITPKVGLPPIGILPIAPLGVPSIGFSGGWRIPSFVLGKSKKKRGKKKYIGLLAGYTEVTLTELLTGHKAHHLMIPAKMAKFWKETLKTGGMIEVPTAEEVFRVA